MASAVYRGGNEPLTQVSACDPSGGSATLVTREALKPFSRASGMVLGAWLGAIAPLLYFFDWAYLAD